MAIQLATPSFFGTPTDEVQQVDAYSQISPEVRNKLVSGVGEFEEGFGSILNNAIKSVKDIGSKLTGSPINIQEAKQRIEGALKGSRSDIQYISQTLENSIFGELTGASGGPGYTRTATSMANEIKLIIDNKDILFNQDGFQGVNSIINFLNDLGGSNTLIKTFDLGAEAAVLFGVLTEVSAWGIPDLIDETFGARKVYNDDGSWRYDYSYDDQFRFTLGKRVSSELSPNASLDVILRILEHAGDGSLLAENPTFIETMMSSYTLPVDTDPSMYPEILSKFELILDKLQPEWLYINRGDEKVYNLGTFNKLSDHTQLVFLSKEKYYVPVMLGPLYQPKQAIQLLKEFYPNIPI